MNIREIEALERQVGAELQQGLALRANLDEQLKALRTQRQDGEKQIATARAMLRFLEAARQTAAPLDQPQPVPAPVDRATITAALSAAAAAFESTIATADPSTPLPLPAEAQPSLAESAGRLPD